MPRKSLAARIAVTPVENPADSSPPPAKGGKAAKEEKNSGGIVIPALKITEAIIRVRGMTPYIAHNFSEKAKKMIRDKKEQRAQAKREPCNPSAEYEAAKYKDADGDDAIPTLAFKCAIVDAASFIEGVTKVQIRGALFIRGEYVKIHCKDESMREDVVRVGMGSADLRYRPIYQDWHVDLPVQFDSDVISPEQVHHLIQRAGFAIGVGEWRPQKDGQYGRFELDKEALAKPSKAA
jgi:hypothetical protein